MKLEELIKIKEITKEPRLLSRTLADVVFESFERNYAVKIEIDFSGIDFISRSFADQFHKNKIDFIEKKNIEIVVVNCKEEVFDMFQEVARTNHSAFVRTYRKSRYNVLDIHSRGDLRKINFSF